MKRKSDCSLTRCMGDPCPNYSEGRCYKNNHMLKWGFADLVVAVILTVMFIGLLMVVCNEGGDKRDKEIHTGIRQETLR